MSSSPIRYPGMEQRRWSDSFIATPIATPTAAPITNTAGSSKAESGDFEVILKDFYLYREEHPGAMSTNAMWTWYRNGKKDREGYTWTLPKRKKKRSRRNKATKVALIKDLREKLPPKVKEVDKAKGTIVINHIHHYNT